jgi:Tfp pilus assembly protein PilF
LGLEYLKAGKIDEAMEHLETATTRFPEDYQGFTYLGVAYAQKGLYNRAVGAFQAAVRLRSDLPSIRYNLGLAYQADGFPDKAGEEFEEALRLDPSYQKAEQALKAIKVEEKKSQDTISDQACARHTDETAVGVCAYCHLPICKECKTEWRGRTYCSNCVDILRRG